MLDLADDVLGLKALHDGPDQLAGEDGIFSQVFEGAAVAVRE